MLSFSLTLLFFFSFILFFLLNISNLLLSLILLELLTFVILWSLASSLTLLSSPFLILTFCIFILESVLGLVGLLNLIHFSGSDYISVSFSTT